jgi:hypothetical protein
MVFGHNTNIKVGAVTLHVQTEDRGEATALIDTTVYFQGRVLHRRTNNYFDLLPMTDDRAQALKLRVGEQHRSVMEDIQSGKLQLPVPVLAAVGKEAAVPAVLTAPAAAVQKKIAVELVNASSWLAGKQARLEVVVKEESGRPVAGAAVLVEIEGSAEHQQFRGTTGTEGQAVVEFDMPRITAAAAALVVHAELGSAKANLKFALRSKPRVPSV